MSPAKKDLSQKPEESAVPYILPFAAFLFFLFLSPHLAFLGRWEFPLRVVILSLVLVVFSRRVIDLRVRFPLSTILLGIAVFVLWIGPDVLFPGYRQHWLFQNAITGELRPGLDAPLRSDAMVLLFRSLRAIVLVPIIEELFWRAWLMRWLINPNFGAVPLGAFSWQSMIITAALFASEHGPYWEVGLITGFIYNWWMVRTRSLGDCILVHAVTNACLSLYVLKTSAWQYWM